MQRHRAAILFRRITPGQQDVEAGTAFGPGMAGDAPAMHLHDGTANRQAQAHACGGAFFAAALKLLEDGFFSPPGQARAVVGHRQLHGITVQVGVDLDGRTQRGVLGRVLQQVDQHPLDQHRVQMQQRQVVGQLHPHRAPGQGCGAGGQRAAHHLFQRLPLAVQPHRASLKPGHVQQVVDQRIHAQRRLPDGAGDAGLGRGGRRLGQGQ